MAVRVLLRCAPTKHATGPRTWPAAPLLPVCTREKNRHPVPLPARHTPRMSATEPIHRAHDGELLGSIHATDDGWQARTVFGATIGRAATREEATRIVHDQGLAALAKRWFHRDRRTGEWQVVVLTEAWPGRARGVVGLYALAGAPPFEITSDDLDAGDMLTLEPPPGMEDLATR